RLSLAKRIAERLVELSGKRWMVEASVDRLDVLRGTDYVINSIEVAGLKNVRFDYDIPMKYGVDQCIGDTIGPGGIFKALRTGPAWLDIVADTQKLAPQATILNYTNPMSILTLGAFVTESSGHFSEYVPYFRKRSDLVQKYARPGYLGESGFYANNWPRWRRENDDSIEAMLNGDKPVPLKRSLEYGADIIEAIE